MDLSRMDHRVRMEEQLRQWSLRRDAIRGMAENAGSAIKAGIWHEVGEIEKLIVAGRAHLAGWESMAVESWEEGKADLVEKWKQVGASVDAVWLRVRNMAR